MKPFDTIVIGGGINGAAIVRDATLRGLKVALFEKKDFGSGTTQYSSRLIHGGLRYLEQGQFGLVYEALREREILFRIAPHFVKPLPFLIPEYNRSKRRWWYIEAGMLLYDALSWFKSVPHHTLLPSAEKVLKVEKGLEWKGLKGGVVYYDGQVNFPERLCLAHIQDAMKHGAFCQNYALVTRIITKGNTVKGVIVKDLRTNKENRYYSSIVVNAAGPWVDDVNHLLSKEIKREIGGTKGIHIVVKRWQTAPERVVYVEAVSDKRPIFIIPWRGYILIGTTDIPYTDELDTVHPTLKEAAYLIEETNKVFLGARLSKDSVIHCYAGVRPLPVVRKEALGDIPRRHLIKEYKDVKGYVSIISGKITTHRSLAEEVVDLILKKPGESWKRCETATRAMFGGEIRHYEEYVNRKVAFWRTKTALDQQQIEYLIAMFGTKYEEILQLACKERKMQQRVSLYHPDIMAEVVYCLRNEFVVTLSDFLQRRTGIGSGEGQGLDCIKKVALLFKEHFSWNNEKMKKEIERYKKEVAVLYTLQ